MNRQTLDLLPTRIRERVRRSQVSLRACRTGLALVAVAAIAAAGAEAARMEAQDRRDELALVADAALKACEARDRLHTELLALVERIKTTQSLDGRVPAATLIAAITEALPTRATLEQIALHEEGQHMFGELRGEAADGAQAAALVAALSATRPFAEVTLDEETADGGGHRFTVRFQIPLDRPFEVAGVEEVPDAP